LFLHPAISSRIKRFAPHELGPQALGYGSTFHWMLRIFNDKNKINDVIKADKSNHGNPPGPLN